MSFLTGLCVAIVAKFASWLETIGLAWWKQHEAAVNEATKDSTLVQQEEAAVQSGNEDAIEKTATNLLNS